MDIDFKYIVAGKKKTAIQRMRGMLFNIKREYNLTDTELANVLGINEDFLYDFMREKYEGEVPFDFVVKMFSIKKANDEEIITPMADIVIDEVFGSAKPKETLQDKIKKLLNIIGIVNEDDIDEFIRKNDNKGTCCQRKECENKSHKEEENSHDDEDELPEGTCGFYCTRDDDGNVKYQAINYNDVKDFLRTLFSQEK